MFKLYKLSSRLPKRIKSITFLNKESIILAFNGVKIQERGKSDIKRYYFSDKLKELINTQIQAEHQAAHNYLAMATAFLHRDNAHMLAAALPGAGGYFMKMYYEELGHMQYFLNYLSLRGATPQLRPLKESTYNPNITLLDAFLRAEKMETQISKQLENIVNAANGEEDFECADFVTKEFLDEQHESINEIKNHITNLYRLVTPYEISHYDLELAKTYPYEYKKRTYEYL